MVVGNVHAQAVGVAECACVVPVLLCESDRLLGRRPVLLGSHRSVYLNLGFTVRVKRILLETKIETHELQTPLSAEMKKKFIEDTYEQLKSTFVCFFFFIHTKV